MRAVCFSEPGGPEVLKLEEVPDPMPQPDEILVDVRAAGVNRADLLQRRGGYPPPAGASPLLGLEIAGVVAAVGERVETLQVGDRVMALLPGGGYAQKVTLPVGLALPIPSNLSFEEAAAIPEAWITAFSNLVLLGNLTAQMDVLIHAGGSGVGTAAIQIVREFGARAHVTAGSSAKLDACQQLGARTCINYHEGPFAPKVLEATGGKGAEIILDFVGAPYWEQNVSCAATDGKIFLIGTMGGAVAEQVNLGLLLNKRLSIIGTSLRSRPLAIKVDFVQAFGQWALPRFASGALHPVLDQIFDWEKVADAHRRMENNQNFGKIVLRIS
ncbi:MAG: NAD(P)H-quinone oxidoreductase [Firmicutes bacterium]|nr:NAD(P)H-quinone oxidoreductase [Bacillota bacterium]